MTESQFWFDTIPHMPRSLSLHGPHTQNWLKMPARDFARSVDGSNGGHGFGTTLLKKHKTLPHPRDERIAEVRPSTPVRKSYDLSMDTGILSMPGSEDSSPHTLKRASKRIGAPGLPPTPPSHSRQSSGTQPIIPSASFLDIEPENSPDIPSVPTTPINHRSPPTPDVTPPKARPVASRITSDRYASSRTESFKTARENPDSSDDEVSTLRPKVLSARPSATEATQMRNRTPKRAVGLGLGLESEGGATPKPADASPEEFVIFDGEWGLGPGDVSEVEREWDDNLMRNVMVRKRRPGKLDKSFDGATDEVVEDNIIPPPRATKVVRSLPLQERIARHRLERDANRITSENLRGNRMSPTSTDEPESPLFPGVRRFSAMSSRSVSSTIVEAMVVDVPPQRRKTLRHTKKHHGLREFSSDQSARNSVTDSLLTDSVISSEPRHRLVHKDNRIPERRHQSLNSNTTVNTVSSSGKSRRKVIKDGGIPVVVIPERRSSSKSREPSLRSTSSHKTKRSLSVGSVPVSHSSKFNDPTYFDNVTQKKRPHSESGSGNSVRTIDFPPDIPARRSSLSAPTSRNNSRANSLTAESLNAHNRQQEKHTSNLLESPMFQQAVETPKDFLRMRLNVDQNGDPFFGKRLSTQVTPFSQVSYETTGTAAEVSEAQAISLYPHQNSSVLMIEHEYSSPPNLKRANASSSLRPRIKLNDDGTRPNTPVKKTHPMDEVDSPLRNPRRPPEPPAIKFIPPTPSDLSPADEGRGSLNYDFEDAIATSDMRPKRGFSLVRRAFSNRRRNSESVLDAPAGLMKRTFSLTRRNRDQSTQTSKAEANPSLLYPSVLDQPADESKLHPFWRPGSFWDDLEDDEYDEDEYNEPDEQRERPLPPQRNISGRLRKTFAILPTSDDPDRWTYTVDRRTVRKSPSGNLRVVKKRSNSSLRREADRRAFSDGDIGYGVQAINGGRKAHVIPGLGISVECVGWGGMKRRYSDRKRAQRSEKLRATISGPKGVQSGVEDVLRGRSGDQV